ncbi:MaoC family dehydratase [Aminobacter aganoensis]|uniref:Acyl dehydratase n=1 Tax=Aminobacter aganoensis TaxID=83264 RepID=A0A7X0F8W7_9HYPH|nr:MULTISPECIES: MaoC family dehydratase [Aminobacter]MBB6355262.1 acyl dehydratase [Aminobacter aganoensis]
MSLKPINLEQLQATVGKEIGVSPWRTVTQEMIDKFADATDDHQFIHCDPERAARETPFGGTIAHGFLTLSLLSAMTFETVPPVEGGDMGINQGFESLKFAAPVKTGSRIRTRFVLADLKIRPSGWIQATHDVTMEIEDQKKPALTARWLTLTFVEPKRETA